MEVVEQARREGTAVVIECRRPEMAQFPFPDFAAFLNDKEIQQYPLQTSRECPYGCGSAP
ncbi:MAG: hypothetical protein ACE5JO_13570 [Candidatus Binatia bacterium]